MILLVTFHSVSDALYTQKMLAGQGISGEVIPVPRDVSSSCGYAVEFAAQEVPALLQALHSAGLAWARLYKQVQQGKSLGYILVKENST